MFKSIFTPVIRIDIQKNKRGYRNVQIRKGIKKYNVKQTRWLSNPDFLFDIHSNNMDIQIIEKIYTSKHTTLKNKADWALGIVTGDNKKFITDKRKRGLDPIYKGKDVEKFVLSKPSSYIRFIPSHFQQVASIERYHSKEKAYL